MKRALAVLLYFLASLLTLPARSEEEIPHACEGKNLFAALQASDPAKAAELQKQADATPNANSLVWKITPKNGAKPSYLMGTIHVTETRVNTISETVKERIRAAQVLALELDEISDKQAMQQAVMARSDLTLMPEGKTLWDVVPDEQEDSIRGSVALALIPDQAKAMFKPWMLGIMAASPMCEQLRSAVKPTLDENLAKLAASANVKLVGLEKLDEQLEAIAGLPMGEQVQLLLASVNSKIAPEDGHRTMVELYLSNNIALAIPLLTHLSGSKYMSADNAFMDRLLGKRNVLMAERAQPLIDAGEAFIAVGALHLPGKDGVVELLRAKGYTLEKAD